MVQEMRADGGGVRVMKAMVPGAVMAGDGGSILPPSTQGNDYGGKAYQFY
jgi:hypothetical protein